MPPDPPSISMLRMLIVLHTIPLPLTKTPPLQNSGSAPESILVYMHTVHTSIALEVHNVKMLHVMRYEIYVHL